MPVTLGRDALDAMFASADACADMRPRTIVSVQSQVKQRAAGELACRPGSVHPLARADGHPSRTAVADSLMRSTREHRAGRPQSLAQASAARAAPPS